MNGRAPCAALDRLLAAVLVVVSLTSPLASLTYLPYPGYIVLVRGASRLPGMERLLAENCLGHFFAVLCLGLALSGLLLILRPPAAVPHCPGLAGGGFGCPAPQRRRAASRPFSRTEADGGSQGRCLRPRRSPNRPLPSARRRPRLCGSLPLEGIALRRAGIQGTILILGYTPPEAVPLLRRWRLTQAVADEAHGHALAAQGRPVRVHLALDTGMHRLGIPQRITAPSGGCSRKNIW